MRIGLGYDIHALKSGRKLVLGGVEIPYRKGLSGHSDADVLYHAAVDALFGALGTGDIGDHFPDTDPRFKGKPGGFFASKALAEAARKGWRVAQIDATLIAQKPKLAPWKDRMRRNLARDFKVRLDAVCVKAKTNEGFDAAGLEKAIVCQALVVLKKGR